MIPITSPPTAPVDKANQKYNSSKLFIQPIITAIKATPGIDTNCTRKI